MLKLIYLGEKAKFVEKYHKICLHASIVFMCFQKIGLGINFKFFSLAVFYETMSQNV